MMLILLFAAGLAVAVDMLVTGGEMKLILPAMLGMLHDLKPPPLLAFLDGALCVAFMSAVLLDCLLYPRTAAFMQGPLMHFLRGTPIMTGTFMPVMPRSIRARQLRFDIWVLFIFVVILVHLACVPRGHSS